MAVILHSGSAVMIKVMNTSLSAVTVTTGGLSVSLPLFALTWLINDVYLPSDMSIKAILSIVYLAAMGSVVGFMLYYFLLQTLNASVVALITLITPVSALLLLGLFFNRETITLNIVIGTFLCWRA